MVTVNISNKAAYVLIGILAVVIFTGIGISLNSGDYLVHGHDSGELDLSGVGGSLHCVQVSLDNGATGVITYDSEAGSSLTFGDVAQIGSVSGVLFHGTGGTAQDLVGVEGINGWIVMGCASGVLNANLDEEAVVGNVCGVRGDSDSRSLVTATLCQ